MFLRNRARSYSNSMCCLEQRLIVNMSPNLHCPLGRPRLSLVSAAAATVSCAAGTVPLQADAASSLPGMQSHGLRVTALHCAFVIPASVLYRNIFAHART